jgi:hypothetical protein
MKANAELITQPRREARYYYRGFVIDEEGQSSFAIRDNSYPWCDSLEEAQEVVDRLVNRAEEKIRK